MQLKYECYFVFIGAANSPGSPTTTEGGKGEAGDQGNAASNAGAENAAKDATSPPGDQGTSASKSDDGDASSVIIPTGGSGEDVPETSALYASTGFTIFEKATSDISTVELIPVANSGPGTVELISADNDDDAGMVELIPVAASDADPVEEDMDKARIESEEEKSKEKAREESKDSKEKARGESKEKAREENKKKAKLNEEERKRKKKAKKTKKTETPKKSTDPSTFNDPTNGYQPPVFANPWARAVSSIFSFWGGVFSG